MVSVIFSFVNVNLWHHKNAKDKCADYGQTVAETLVNI